MNNLNQSIPNNNLYNNGLFSNGMGYGNFNPTPTQGNFGNLNAYNSDEEEFEYYTHEYPQYYRRYYR